MTLIAEDLLLLLLDDDSGALPGLWVDVSVPLGAAVLAELAIDGDVERGPDAVWLTPVVPGGEAWRSPQVIPEEGAREADPVLADGLATVREQRRTADDLAPILGDGLEDRLTERLVAAGVLERREGKALGLFPRTRYPATRTTGEAAVRDRLRAVLLEGVDPAPRDTALIGLLQALDRVPQTFGLHGEEARTARDRATVLSEQDWPSRAVRDAIAVLLAASESQGLAGGIGTLP